MMTTAAWLLVLLCECGMVDDDSLVKNAEPPTVETVKNALAARDAAWDTLTFRVTYHDQSRARRGEPLQASMQVDDVIQDHLGRLRLDMVISLQIDKTNGKATKSLHVLNTLDAKGLIKILNLDETGKTYLGKIQAVGGMYWPIPPMWLLHLDSRSPEKYLSVSGFKVDGTSSISGYDVIGLKWQANDPDAASSRQGTFWVAPSLGYAVVKTEILRRPRTDLPWRKIQQTDASDYVLVGGMWLPAKASYEEYLYYDDGGYELNRKTDAVFENWELNRKYPIKTFDLEFPDGTLVHDQRAESRRYVQGKINDRLVRSEVEKARELGFGNPDLEQQFDKKLKRFNSEGNYSWGRIILGVVGAIVILASCWTLFRRATRRTH